mmetsp:Transcript_9495/g.29226  ORF Transcript_9495/g.29226 Transcript_9495/m.29226 type:complete len:335 (+) Transcript_9495:77-1081(+)
MLPELPRPQGPPRRRQLRQHSRGGGSLPVLPPGPLVPQAAVVEQRHLHHHYHVVIRSAKPSLQRRALDAARASPSGGDALPPSPPTPARAPRYEPSGSCAATMSTAELLLGAVAARDAPAQAAGEAPEPGAGRAGQAPRRKQHPHIGPRVHTGRQQDPLTRTLTETQVQWDRYVSAQSASRPNLERPPLWGNTADLQDDAGIARRVRLVHQEGQWSQHREDMRRQLKDLRDSASSNMKRKLVGDPRLRNAHDRAAIERVKKADMARCNHTAAAIQGAMQACSRSRHQLVRMQGLLRSAEGEEAERLLLARQAAAAQLLRGEGPLVARERSDGAH